MSARIVLCWHSPLKSRYKAFFALFIEQQKKLMKIFLQPKLFTDFFSQLLHLEATNTQVSFIYSNRKSKKNIIVEFLKNHVVCIGSNQDLLALPPPVDVQVLYCVLHRFCAIGGQQGEIFPGFVGYARYIGAIHVDDGCLNKPCNISSPRYQHIDNISANRILLPQNNVHNPLPVRSRCFIFA